MNPLSPSRFRPEVAGRVKRLWLASVERVEHFFFIIGIWVCVKRILEESRRCPPRFTRGEYLKFKKPQNAGKTVLAVGPNLVKLFSMVNSKYLAATPVAEGCMNASCHLKAMQAPIAMSDAAHSESDSCESVGLAGSPDR
jgi:hypothetical protein